MESKDTTNNVKEQLNSNNKLRNIKSNFILKVFFSHFHELKTFELIKYNKYIQKRMNININDYKTCCEKYSSIEIEIIPIIPQKKENGQFMNIKKEDEEYYHIYFNNNKKDEIKRTYLKKNDKVSKINIIIDYQVKSLSGLFHFCDCFESINFKKFSRNNITDMSNMFLGCSKLKELNLTSFNTDNVITMGWMFSDCSSLKVLNLSNFNTNKVTNMGNMFFCCSSLKELNINNFNTNNVTDMSDMFYGCSSLIKLNITNFNINTETNVSFMFGECLNELKSKIKKQFKNIKEEAFYE